MIDYWNPRIGRLYEKPLPLNICDECGADMDDLSRLWDAVGMCAALDCLWRCGVPVDLP